MCSTYVPPFLLPCRALQLYSGITNDAGLMYEISRSANIQTMGMKLSLAMSPSLERFESAGGFSNKFEIDPAVVDRQVNAANDD